MANASFVQHNFSGGEWSADAQGQFADPAYKTALNVCLNAWPTEQGAWTRRPGFRYLQHTKTGHPAVLREFDFTTTQPYQMEFTDSFLRFFAGLSLLTTTDVATVANIDTSTPAKVFLAGTVPSDWANGNTVIFTLNSSPCAGPALCNRQFVIANVNTAAGTFTLADPITGASVAGSTIAYAVGTTLDQVRKVHELASPYLLANLTSVRTVQDQTSVLLLHGSFQPRLVNAGTSPAPFQIAAQNFADGPYLDVPGSTLVPNTTTLTPSGVSGSITVTASAVTNINGNSGFQTTDVGRLIRFQGGPKAWSIATTYAKESIVLGSDNNIYKALTGANIAHDPTTDDGTNWQISDQTIILTWMKITARASTTSVTATIMGHALNDTTASLIWQLGLYSDTTGWPTAGAYHEGRLWLTSTAFPNRADGSVSNDYFNFSPSDTDGTVADNNAVAAVFNANDANAIYWLLSTDDGLMCGTQAGIRRIRASVLDDPLSDSNIQERRVDTYGCANIEPAQPGEQTVFVQRSQRKVLGSYQATNNRYTAENVTQRADHVTGEGISELRWQQEPSLNLWLRKADNTLAGCVYRRAGYEAKTLRGESDLTGFHRVTLGSTRVIEAMSSGPSADGLSDTLYAVTNKTVANDPDYNVRWVECLTPLFDPASDDCDAFFVDGGVLPCCTKLNGSSPSFTGITIYGLWHLNGLTVQAYIGGLDLGDFTVASGAISITFGDTSKGRDAALFTLAYFQALATCELTGAQAANTVTTTHVNTLLNDLETFVAAGTPVQYQAGGGFFFTDPSVPYVVGIQNVVGGSTGGIQVYNRNTTGDEVGESSNTTVFGAGPAHIFYTGLSSRLHPNGNYYSVLDGATNNVAVSCVRVSDRTSLGITGTAGAGFGSDATHVAALFGMAPVVKGANNYLVTCGEVSAGNTSEIAVWNCNAGPIVYVIRSHTTDYVATDVIANVCEGLRGRGDYYVIGHTNYAGNATTPIGLYEGWAPSAVLRPICSLTPAQIDATWTHTAAADGPGYDQADGNVLFFVQTLDAVANTFYLVKVNTLSGAVMWKCALGSARGCDLTLCNINGSLQIFDDTNHNVITIDLSAGTKTTTAWNNGISVTTPQFFDGSTGSIFSIGTYAASAGPVPTLIGQYFGGHVGVTSRILEIYSVANLFSTNVTTTFNYYGNVGFTYNSDGQLLEPDAGADAGAQNGPAFGKTRRLHRYAAKLYRTRGLSIGTDFTHMRPVPLTTAGGAAISAPTFYSDSATDVIESDYDLHGRIAWRISRPYPCTVTALGGFISSADR